WPGGLPSRAAEKGAHSGPRGKNPRKPRPDVDEKPVVVVYERSSKAPLRHPVGTVIGAHPCRAIYHPPSYALSVTAVGRKPGIFLEFCRKTSTPAGTFSLFGLPAPSIRARQRLLPQLSRSRTAWPRNPRRPPRRRNGHPPRTASRKPSPPPPPLPAASS